MIPYTSAAIEATFTRFVVDWFRLLALGEIDNALSMLDEPSSYGAKWTADSISEELKGYSINASISDPDELPLSDHRDLLEFSDGSGYAFDHPVPISGCWSDLTAQFEFLKRPEGFAVVLQDLHVL